CSMLALIGFVKVEAKRGEAALVPLDMFKLKTFRGIVTATAGMTFGMYGVLFLQPLSWQTNSGFSPVEAGLGLVPMAVTYVAVSPFSGRFRDKLGTHFSTAGGVGIIGIGMLIVGATTHVASII